MAAGVNVDFIAGAAADGVGGEADGFADLFDAEPILSAKGFLELFEDGGGFVDLFAVAAEAELRRRG